MNIATGYNTNIEVRVPNQIIPTPMPQLFDLLTHGDACSLGVLIVLLLVLGNTMTAQKPTVRAWGLRIAAVTFVGLAGYLLYRYGTSDADTLVWIGFRSLIGAGIVLGASWILLTIVAFVSESGRDAVSRSSRRITHWKKERSSSHELESASQQSRFAAAEAAEHQRQEQEEMREAQTRRLAARVECERLYLLHQHQLQGKFTREQYDNYVQSFLSDEQEPEIVESFAEKLQDIIRTLAGESGDQTALTIQQQAEELERQIKDIEESNFDPKTKQVTIAALRRKFAGRIEKDLED